MLGSTTTKGAIEIQRIVDLEKGVVMEFTAKLTATFDTKPPERGGAAGGTPGGGNITRCEIDEQWTFDRIEKNREPDFKQKVADAIKRDRCVAIMPYFDESAQWHEGFVGAFEKV